MIGLLGWAFALVVIAVRLRRRRRHTPRALLLAEAADRTDLEPLDHFEKRGGLWTCPQTGRVAGSCYCGACRGRAIKGDDPRALEARADWRTDSVTGQDVALLRGAGRCVKHSELGSPCTVTNCTTYAVLHEFGGGNTTPSKG